MKHLLALSVFFALLALAISCNSPKEKDGFTLASTQIPYKFHQKTDGLTPNKGDVVIFDWRLETDEGKELLGKAAVGDSMTIRLTPSMLYRTRGLPEGVGKNDWVNCHLKITDISSLSSYQKEEAAILEKLRARRAAKNDSLLQAQAKSLQASFQKMDNGVYYHIKEKGLKFREKTKCAFTIRYTYSMALLQMSHTSEGSLLKLSSAEVRSSKG